MNKKPPYPAIARGNKKNPPITIRTNAIDPEGTLLPQLRHHFPLGEKIDWNAVAIAAIAHAECMDRLKQDCEAL